jgi:hypothetical protein
VVPTISLGANRLGSRLELRTRGNFAHLSREAGSLHDRLLAIMMSEFARLVPNQYIVEFGSAQSAFLPGRAAVDGALDRSALAQGEFCTSWLLVAARLPPRYADTIRDDYIDAAETVAAAVARPFLPRNKDALKLLIGARGRPVETVKVELTGT